MASLTKRALARLKWLAGLALIPLLARILKWLWELVFGDAVLSAIKHWVNEESVQRYGGKLLSLAYTYPIRTAIILMCGAVATSFVGAWHSVHKHHGHKTKPASNLTASSQRTATHLENGVWQLGRSNTNQFCH